MFRIRIPRACLAALLLALPLAACAREDRLVELQVVDADRGQPLEVMPFRGRDYVAGEPGRRFALSLRNLTGQRVLAVVSVDGVNAVSGQTASASQAGYVLEPWQRIEVRGWRKSYSDVAEFYFTDLPDSYAARTGRPDNAGVIGVAAFRERSAEVITYEAPPAVAARPGYERERNGAADAAAPAARAEGGLAKSASPAPYAPTQQLGTGHGERRYDPVAQTRFERNSAWPNQRIALYYDSWNALAARGVVPRAPYGQPEPFPLGFVPDPR